MPAGLWELGCCGSWGSTSYLWICWVQKAPCPPPPSSSEGPWPQRPVRKKGSSLQCHSRVHLVEAGDLCDCTWEIVADTQGQARVPVLLICGQTVAAHWGARSVSHSKDGNEGPWSEMSDVGTVTATALIVGVGIKSDDFHINHFKQCLAQTQCYRILANMTVKMITLIII